MEESFNINSLIKILNILDAEVKNAYDLLVAKNASEKEQACALRAVEHLLKLDPDLPTLLATVLFQIPDITQDDLADIKNGFGREVAGLVKDLMKFSRIKFQINTSEKRQTFIKRAIFVLSNDNRALYAKLATRLAKLEVRKPVKNATLEEIAQETLDIHVPLANLLGLWELHCQLEDKCFEYLHPHEYQKIALYKANKFSLNTEHIIQIEQTLHNIATTAEIHHSIEVVEKNLYEIYRKEKKKFNANSLKDVMLFKVTVTSQRDCYRMLGLIHSIWKPQNQNFKDFISLPKINGYQALHTTVFGPNERICLFQITTPEFLKQQQISIRSNKKGFANKVAYDWLKSTTGETLTSDENLLMQGLKNNNLERSIVIFTNKGKIINLPQYASCIDAAYHISIYTGNHYMQAYVNQNKVPHYYTLQTGDTVEIKTLRHAPGPKLEWISYTHTEKSRQAIQNFLKKLPWEDQKLSGKYEIERLLKQLFSKSWQNQERLLEKRGKEKLNFATLDDLFAYVGQGESTAKKILTQLFSEDELLAKNSINPRQRTKLDIKCINKIGMLKGITDKIVDSEINIEQVFTKPDSAHKTSLVSILAVISNFDKLYHTMQRIEHIPGVLFVERDA